MELYMRFEEPFKASFRDSSRYFCHIFPKATFKLILFSRESNLSHSFKTEKIAKSTKCSNTSILKNEAKLLKVTNVQSRNIVYMVS